MVLPLITSHISKVLMEHLTLRLAVSTCHANCVSFSMQEAWVNKNNYNKTSHNVEELP